MGQLNVVLELSRFANLICIGVVLLLIALLSVNVNAQTEGGNCVFETDKIRNESTHWIIVGDSISEKTDVDEIIWEMPTSNIKSSISSSHPHAKYLTGLLYSARYVYKSAMPLSGFVDREKTTTIVRNVTFTCTNDVKIAVNFEFPLDDENDAPKFQQVPAKVLTAEIGLPEPEVINKDDPIIVWDKDFTDSFNEVNVTTDRPDEFVIISLKIENPTNAIGKEYDVKLKLNDTTNNIRPGMYNLNLFASDGKLTASAPLRIHITSSS